MKSNQEHTFNLKYGISNTDNVNTFVLVVKNKRSYYDRLFFRDINNNNWVYNVRGYIDTSSKRIKCPPQTRLPWTTIMTHFPFWVSFISVYISILNMMQDGYNEQSVSAIFWRTHSGWWWLIEMFFVPDVLPGFYRILFDIHWTNRCVRNREKYLYKFYIMHRDKQEVG